MRINKLLIIFSCLLFLVLSADHACLASNIVVVKSRDIAPYNEAFQGFGEAVEKAGITVWEIQFDLEKEGKGQAAILNKIRAMKPDLVLTIGSEATEMVKGRIKGVPVVFTMVLDPVESGIVSSLRAPGGNLTGASMNIPPELRFRLIKMVLPGRNKIGVIYNPAETGRSVKAAATAARKQGLELVAFKVKSRSEVPEVVEGLEGKIDVLWAVADSTVFTPQSVPFIILETLRAGIPFVGISPAYCRAGALMAFALDYRDIGRQSGELAVKVLRGAKPGTIPVSVPRKVSFVLNLNTAKRIGVRISKQVIGQAGEVIKE